MISELIDQFDGLSFIPNGDLLVGSHLNLSQLETISYQEGPLLSLAVVGSGKTETLMRKYAYIIEKGAGERDILAVTFTNKAAFVMNDRA